MTLTSDPSETVDSFILGSEEYCNNNKNRQDQEEEPVAAEVSLSSDTAMSASSSETPTLDLMSRLMMPSDFTPAPYTVIFGRGKHCTQSIGNRRMRIIVGLFVSRYAAASSRNERTDIVSQIHEMLLQANQESPKGAFVRYSKGRYFQVETMLVREKIGGILRDALPEFYSSSTKRKLAARKERKMGMLSKKSPPRWERTFFTRGAELVRSL